jgi:TatA/E family protein of Tat protein translocase
MIGPTDLVMVALVALVFVGPKRLPEAGQRLGRALREFQTMTAEIRSQTGLDEIANSVNDIKSVLSLTGADRPPTIDAVASVPASSIPAMTDAAAEAPATATTAPQEGSIGGAPFGADPAEASPVDDQSARDCDNLAAATDEECGVETFGRLKRGSTVAAVAHESSGVEAFGHLVRSSTSSRVRATD